MDEYNIYVVNNSADEEDFWCFLERPEELESDPKVYANSSAWVTVAPDYEGIDFFTIPVQYSLKAGAAHKPIGLGIKITAENAQEVNLTDTWHAEYQKPRRGPELTKQYKKAPDNMIRITTNHFDKRALEAAEWYGNLSFGILTSAGFIGMTWSPRPDKQRDLTPQLTFYIAVGEFGSNKLADWTDVSREYAKLSVPKHFDHQRNSTVYYNSKGDWDVRRGKPTKLLVSAQPDDETLLFGSAAAPTS